MTTEILMYSYCFAGGGLLTLILLGLLVSIFMPGTDRRSRQFFISSFFILALSIAAYFVDLFIYTDPSLAWAERIIAFIETLLPPALLPLLSVYILDCCGEKRRGSGLFRTELALFFVLFVLLCVTQFTEGIYYFTPDNRFIRGSRYPILIIPIILMIAADLSWVIIRRNKLTKKKIFAFLVFLIPSLIAMTIQAFVNVFLLIVCAVSVSALSMLGIILAEQIEQYVYQQKKISDQRASIAVLQMRPHFIYNTMLSIYYLCEQDPKKARQVTLDFTTYLRKNFNAISGDNTIPFSEELEHTRAYLAVEQAQFDDNLIVEYDTPHTRFYLPALTLQPVVENAVKHGMDPDADEPLRIMIRAQKTDNGAEIIVEDNGPGFGHPDDKDPHIALNNIRERLTLMCGGSLEIVPRETGGTRVIIRIP